MSSSVLFLFSTVKYKAPQKISFSWFKNNLNLTWMAEEVRPALAEVLFRKYEHPTGSWEKVRHTCTLFSGRFELHSVFNLVSMLRLQRLLTTNFTNSGKSTREYLHYLKPCHKFVVRDIFIFLLLCIFSSEIK